MFRFGTSFTGLILIFSSAGFAQSVTQIDEKRSILITDSRLLNAINEDYNFGEQLGHVSAWADKLRDKHLAPGDFVTSMIYGGLKEQREHNASANRLGSKIGEDRALGVVFDQWMGASKLEKIEDPRKLRGGPFRLLAVANLMDAAGTMDDRGLSDATRTPRPLGEVHLVFGLINKDYEKRTGRAFPLTFVLTYRLPALEWSGDGTGMRVATMDLASLMNGDDAWRYKMKLWAHLWSRLSEFPIHSKEYEHRLRRILGFAVQPENFLNVRANVQVSGDEFELREWYMIPATQKLITMKPHFEPYRCLSGSRELTQLVNHYWRTDYNDLDVTTFSPDKPLRKGFNGYMVWRDTDDARSMFPGVNSFSTCGKKPGDMPFEMAVNYPASIMMTASFGRTKNEIWKLENGTPEVRRHAFAIRTCTGCHSSEGATRGFHIFPRLAGEESKLSPFITGQGANAFKNDGAVYRYNILKTRKEWLEKSLSGTAVLGESRMRPETPH